MLKIKIFLVILFLFSFSIGNSWMTYAAADNPPSAPIVNGVTDQSNAVTGIAQAGTTITVSTESITLGTGSTGDDGTFSVSIALQTVGTTLIVTATDSSGNTSELTIVKITDGTPPKAPIVFAGFGDTSTKIEGLTEANAKVFVLAGSQLIGQGTANYKGMFSIPITEKQTAGAKVSLYAQDAAGNKSDMITTTVKDLTPPAMPTVNPVGDLDTVITGKAEPNVKVVSEFSAGYLFTNTAMADSNGDFSIFAGKHSPGSKINVYTEDEAGNKSIPVAVTVIDNSIPEIDSVDPIADWSTEINGAGKEVSFVIAKIGDTEIGRTTTGDQTFRIYIPKQKAGTVITLTAIDPVGHISDPVNVTVLDGTAPDQPTVNPVDDNDTVITGKAEPGAKVTAYWGWVHTGLEVGSAIADNNGNYSIPIVPQRVGADLVLQAVDQAGNGSYSVETWVVDKTPPSVLTVNPIGDIDTVITGKTEPNALVYLKMGGELTSTAADYYGNFSFSINQQKVGTEVELYAEDGAGNQTKSVFSKVLDKTPPAAPTVNPVGDNQTVITGTAEPFSIVKGKVGSQEFSSKAANSAGQYSITVPKIGAGMTVELYATDRAGNQGKSIFTTVLDKTAPNAPTVNTIGDNQTTIMGSAEGFSVVKAMVGSKLIGNTKATANWQFSIKVPKLTEGTIVQLYAIDGAGNQSKSIFTTVVDKTPPTLTVNAVTNKAAVVTGKTEKYAAISVRIGTMNLYLAKADSAGNFKVALPVQNAGTSISITAADRKGNVSKAIIIKVQRVAPNMPTVNPVNNKSTSVSGITEGNAMVTVKIGTKAYTTNADANGNYKVTIPVQYESNAISITAKDSMGNVSAAMEISVVRVAPNIPDVDAVTNQSTFVTGATNSNVTITIKIGTKTYIANADGYGRFKVAIPKQKTGTTLYINAKDVKGSVSATRIVKVL